MKTSRISHKNHLKSRLTILTVLLLSGMTLTVAIIIMFSFIIIPDLSHSDVNFVLTTGVIDFLLCCPMYYYFNTTNDNSEAPIVQDTGKSSNLRFQYNILRNVPRQVTVNLCMKWLVLTIMFAFIGIMCGMLLIFLYLTVNTQLARSEYLSPFLNGTLIAYCSGGISWYINIKNKTNSTITLKHKRLSKKKSVIFALICSWIILFTMSVFYILLETHGIILNIIICICLCFGIVISISLIKVMVANNNLELEIQDHSLLIGQLRKKNNEVEELNKNLENQKTNLFKKERETINRLCREYSEKWESEKTRPLLLNSLKNEVTKLRSSEYKKSLDAEFKEYYGDLFSELRQSNILKPDEIYFLQLIIAGFSQKSISHILDIHPKNFYTKKYRLIDKILASDIIDKENIVVLIKS